MASRGIQTRASAVGVGRLNHHAIIYRRMANFRQATKLGILSVAPPPPPPPPRHYPHQIRISISASPAPYWLSLKCSNGSPFHSHRGCPHLQQIHTQASTENRTQQSAHMLQSHRSYILNPSHSARVSWRH